MDEDVSVTRVCDSIDTAFFLAGEFSSGYWDSGDSAPRDPGVLAVTDSVEETICVTDVDAGNSSSVDVENWFLGLTLDEGFFVPRVFDLIDILLPLVEDVYD